MSDPFDDPVEPYLRALRRARRRTLVLGLLATATTLAAVVAVVGTVVTAAWWQPILAGEADVWGQPRYSPAFPIDPAATARVDLEAVHADLLPGWVIAQGRGARSPQAEEAAQRVTTALGPDPNLVALFDEVRSVVNHDAWDGAERLLYLAWAWNTYLDRAGAPWRIDVVVLGNDQDRPVFYVKTYRVIVDVEVAVGSTRQRARLTERADGLNVVERYLGHTTRYEEGALVVVDRTRDFALDRVWPLLADEVPDDLPGLYPAFASAVREEVRAAVPPEHMEVLVASATDRVELLDAVGRIDERRRCGSDLVVTSVPWRGLDDRSLGQLADLARTSDRMGCPPVTVDEAIALADASDRLAHTEGLREALGSLLAVVARAVTVHEVRHVADGTGVVGPSCPGCRAGLGGMARAELSAYLASFAHPGTAAISMLQACDLADQEGSHGTAFREIELHLAPDGCAISGPPPDLVRRASELEQVYLSRSESIVLPASFPTTLPVDER